MKGIIYENDGKDINIIHDNHPYFNSLPIEFQKNYNKILTIFIHHSFGYNFTKFHEKESLIEKIFEYEKLYGKLEKIIFIFNEIIIDPTEIYKLENEIFIKCYYSSYDMEKDTDGKKLFLPLSLLSQLNYALNSGYLEAKKFLLTMTSNYRDLIKPHKAVFLSNHITPIRIEIFNLLKTTNNLKNCAWSFQKRKQYYSGTDKYIDDFFEENQDLIPYSYDGFDDKLTTLKSTYFYQFESYFEISTESYFFRDVKNIQDVCPITEKIVKPILSFIPFILFGAPKTKHNLERIGMTFNCPLYGFYDNTNNKSIAHGIKHVTEMIQKDRKELHSIYFDYFDEFTKNNNLFITHFNNLLSFYKKNILENRLI